MAYRYLDESGSGDVAFEATGAGPGELFRDSWTAALHVLLENPEALRAREHRTVHLEEPSLDLLLHAFLEELIYYKDAEQLLLRPREVHVDPVEKGWRVRASLDGERLEVGRHRPGLDIKAVALHRLLAERNAGGWQARVILDT